MGNIFVLNNTNRYLKSIIENTSFQVNVLDKNSIKEYENKIKISVDSKLYKDYLRLIILYENGGLILDGNILLLKNIDSFFENDIFLGFKNENELATNIIWCKEKNNKVIENLLHEIEKKPDSSITDIFSKVLNRDFKHIYNSLVSIDKKIYIYPYDYFYPLDYEKHGKNLSENTKIILYENSKLSFKRKIDLKIFRKYGMSAFRYYLSVKESARNNIGAKKYALMRRFKRDLNKKMLQSGVNDTIRVLTSYKNKKVDYIIFHNPRWLGVTSATQELFDNLVPLQELIDKKMVLQVVNKILELDPKQVIFSAFCDGWKQLAEELKKKNPNILLKSFWHGSHSQVIEDINWRTNLDVISLHKAGIIDVMGTCKASLLKFYESQGYKAAFIKNTVKLDEKILQKIKSKEDVKNEADKKAVRIGMYAAGLGWRKNMFTQIAAASLVKNAIIDSVPISFESEVFASKFGKKIDGLAKSIKREELLNRLAMNDINLYVTFSECAPMLPIESMEVGTICLLGNNNHYFKDTELEKYLVVDREDDVMAIYEKINYALENKEEIFRLYKEWKKMYDAESKISVENFLSM